MYISRIHTSEIFRSTRQYTKRCWTFVSFPTSANVSVHISSYIIMHVNTGQTLLGLTNVMSVAEAGHVHINAITVVVRAEMSENVRTRAHTWSKHTKTVSYRIVKLECMMRAEKHQPLSKWHDEQKKCVYIYIYTHAHIEVIEITGDIDTINTNSDETKGPLCPMRPAA